MSLPNARDCEHGHQRGKCPHCDLAAALAEIERLRTELQWYADPDNYQDGVPGYVYEWRWQFDKGNRARKALEGDA